MRSSTPCRCRAPRAAALDTRPEKRFCSSGPGRARVNGRRVGVKPGRASPMQYDRASTYARMRATRARALHALEHGARPAGWPGRGRPPCGARPPASSGPVRHRRAHGHLMDGRHGNRVRPFVPARLPAGGPGDHHLHTLKAGREADLRRGRTPTGPFAVGDTYRETVTVRNHGRTPKAWVEVEDKDEHPRYGDQADRKPGVSGSRSAGSRRRVRSCSAASTKSAPLW